jgi:hypothetical protein
MRICSCLWGGIYNPIIPVFRTAPKEWKPSHPELVKGHAIARGYVEFYEPDAFVEAEEGLLEEAGLGALRSSNTLDRRVVLLRDFLRPSDHRDWSEPHFGLGVVDVLRQVYEQERRFQLRDPRPAILVRPQRGTALVESMFGAYPGEKHARYIGKAFDDVYQPETLAPGVEAWRKVFRGHGVTPLSVSRHAIEVNRSWMNDLVIYVFNPEKAVDLIDLWNLRLEPNPILPVPMLWFSELVQDIREALIAEHRPLQGNPNGVMHGGTVEFARSIKEASAMAAIELLAPMPEGTLSVKTWRTRVWVRHTNDLVRRDARLEITAKERRLSLDIEEGKIRSTKFDSLAPDFASAYGGGALRWVNAVKLTAYGTNEVATVVPFNTFDWTWPRLAYLGAKVTVGTEGWVFEQKFKDSTEMIQLNTPESIIVGTFKRAGIEAKLSEPGHIARQVLNHLGGLWGVHLLADRETLHLLNAMAGGLRKRKAGELQTEEEFDRRSKSIRDWEGLMGRRSQAKLRPNVTLDDFTKRNILRLGIETACPEC